MAGCEDGFLANVTHFYLFIRTVRVPPMRFERPWTKFYINNL